MAQKNLNERYTLYTLFTYGKSTVKGPYCDTFRYNVNACFFSPPL